MAKKLYVGNLPYDVDEEMLRGIFTDGGWATDEVVIITDRDTGRPRGFGFVTLSDNDNVADVIAQLNGRELGGRGLVVNEARERESSGGGDRRGGGGRGGYGGGGGRRGGGRY
jgi:RNA recognition motif-containing protein